MQRVKLVIMMVVLSAGLSGQSVELVELANPAKIIVLKNRLFVSEKTRVFVYSLANNKFIKEFGKPGEGPGEFKLGHGETGVKLNVNENFILINSAAKLSYYSHVGEYLKEIKVPPLHHFIPLTNNFVSSTRVNVDNKALSAVYLFNKAGKKVKELLLTDIVEGMGVKIYSPAYNFKYAVFKDKVYVSSAKEKILINVFDREGHKVSRITGDLKKIPLTDAYKNEVKKDYQLDPRTKNFWSYLKQYLTFPEHFPALRDFFIDGNLLYVQTYKKKGDSLLWIIYDLGGREIKRIWLPCYAFYSSQPSLHCIANNKYYFLSEDEENDGWLLNSKIIK